MGRPSLPSSVWTQQVIVVVQQIVGVNGYAKAAVNIGKQLQKSMFVIM